MDFASVEDAVDESLKKGKRNDGVGYLSPRQDSRFIAPWGGVGPPSPDLPVAATFCPNPTSTLASCLLKSASQSVAHGWRGNKAVISGSKESKVIKCRQTAA